MDGCTGAELGRTVARVDPVIEHAMQTTDGGWRVEVVRRGRSRWYRLVHDDNLVDWLTIAAVHRLLAEAGIDMAELTEVAPTAPKPVDNAQHGVA